MTETVLTVTIENLAPEQGTHFSPVWVGFHDGGFDIYDAGESLLAFPGTEELAEDGNNGPISDRFAEVGAGSVQGTIGGAPIAPGETLVQSFTVDSDDPSSRFFSYASMILPSNDAFIANDNPLLFEIFSETGEFLGTEFIVSGSQVVDAGTEINDEEPTNAAFLAQVAPQTGIDETAPVVPHEGFIPGGPILSEFPEADFTSEGFEVSQISVTEVSSDGDLSTIEVTVTNLAPEQGTFFTPVWVGFHDGGFDVYNPGESLLGFPGTEELAEDGNLDPIFAQFDAVGAGTVQGAVGSAPIAPGSTFTQTFTIDRSLESSRFFSYAAMILPSNDAFVANANPLAFEIVDADGNFIGADFTVLGSQVVDAGTEVNDEEPTNAAFLGQVAPQTGIVETAPVVPHEGFIPGGTILTEFPEADFTQPDYEVVRITVTAEPLATDLAPAAEGLVVGTAEDDEILAGIATDAAADAILTGAGADTVDVALDSAAAGGNIILTGSDDDTIALGADDIVSAGSGDDTIVAFDSAGGNRASGGTGNDTFLLGSAEDLGDRFLGGAGDDTFVVGESGGNVISGGTGSDTFNILTDDAALLEAANIVTDFVSGEDVLGLLNQGADFDFAAQVTFDGNGVFVDGNLVATLLGIDTATLTVEDFQIA